MIGKSLGHDVDVKSRNRPISIGEFSFVGRNCILMPGVSIGKGCVIGAGSVVRGVIPDYSIVIGNPAKVVADSREYYTKHMLDAD
jgi:acetyltransferase-like isoleucine patch superfamily enzyme